MRFNIYISMLVVGLISNVAFSAPVPDDGNQPTSTTSTPPSASPTKTPNSNSTNVNGPVNNGQNNDKGNQVGNDGMITIPIQIDTTLLRALLNVDQSGQNDPLSGNVIQLDGLPALQHGLDSGKNGINNKNVAHPIITPTPNSNSTTTSSTSASSISTPPSTQSPPAEENQSNNHDTHNQKRQELNVRHPGNTHENVQDPYPYSCSKRACGADNSQGVLRPTIYKREN